MALGRGLSLVAGVAIISGCGGGDGSASPSAEATSPTAAVSCVTGGAQSFTDACTVEQARADGAPILVVRHADGGFRRFAVKDDSVVEADGAEQAVVTRTGSTLDVAVGSDRYRLDARLLADGR